MSITMLKVGLYKHRTLQYTGSKKKKGEKKEIAIFVV